MFDVSPEPRVEKHSRSPFARSATLTHQNETGKGWWTVRVSEMPEMREEFDRKRTSSSCPYAPLRLGSAGSQEKVTTGRSQAMKPSVLAAWLKTSDEDKHTVTHTIIRPNRRSLHPHPRTLCDKATDPKDWQSVIKTTTLSQYAVVKTGNLRFEKVGNLNGRNVPRNGR